MLVNLPLVSGACSALMSTRRPLGTPALSERSARSVGFRGIAAAHWTIMSAPTGATGERASASNTMHGRRSAG